MITIVQPQTAEEVEALRGDIELLIQQFGQWDEDFVDWVRDHPGILTLTYVDGEPAGYIRIDGFEVGKESLEFSGCVMPQYREELLTSKVTPLVIAKAFRETGKKKMLAIVPDGNREARVALQALGFRHIGKTEDKRLLYKLDRRDALGS